METMQHVFPGRRSSKRLVSEARPSQPDHRGPTGIPRAGEMGNPRRF